MSLVIYHTAGFFSCCTIKLHNILEFFNKYKCLPQYIDCRAQFKDYKVNLSDDITHEFFSYTNDVIPHNKNVTIIDGDVENQFANYKDLHFSELNPFIKKYFLPSADVQLCTKNILSKYNINVSNTCAVFYRGNDKSKETTQPSYEEIVDKTRKVIYGHPELQLLVQTDEIEFLEFFLSHFPKALVIDEVPKIKKQRASIQHVLAPEDKLVATKNFVATIHIMSQCKYVVHTSGNGEMWMALYRGHANGLFQYSKPCEYLEYEGGRRNPCFDVNKTDYWFDN